MNSPVYSPLFSVLYDELAPVGSIGIGAHYSIFSSVQWRKATGELLSLPLLHRMAVIWDEDHDTRVINVLEAAYMNGHLSPVLFIGERKARLTVVVDDQFLISDDYINVWSTLVDTAINDSWTVEVVTLDDIHNVQIISDRREVVETYLANIRNIWKLGMHAHPSQPFDTGRILGEVSGKGIYPVPLNS